jgi:hypothetical protein
VTRHLGTAAAIGWASTGDAASERVHLLAVPLRDVRPASSRATYHAESLDRTVVQRYTVGDGAHELVGLVRFDDDPQSLLDLLRAGAEGQTLTYYPDVRDPAVKHACTLMAPVGPDLALAVEQARQGYGNVTTELRLRRTDGAALAPLDQGSGVLLWYRGGGSLEGYTFTRATATTRIDKGGLYAAVSSGFAATDWVDADGDGLRELPALRLAAAATNLCLQSENFGTTWSAIGSPTRSAAAKTCGTVSLDLIGDDSAAALEGYTQAVTFTGDAVKAVSIHVAQGTSTSSVIRLRDVTAGTNKMLAVLTWSSGVPSVAMTTGTYLGKVALANGVYRLLFQTTSVTAANTNNVDVYPATDAALAATGTGDVYAGGVQAENALFPGPYIKTTTTTATRNADALSATFSARPQAMSVYARFIEQGSIHGGSTRRIIHIGSGSDPRLLLMTTSTVYRFHYDQGSSTVESVAATAPAIGDVVELLGTITDAGVVQLTQAINGTAATASASSALALPTAWSDTKVYVGASQSPGAEGNIQLLNAVVARGVRSLDEMRRLAKL